MVSLQPDPTKCHCCNEPNLEKPAPDCPDCKGTGRPGEPADVAARLNKLDGVLFAEDGAMSQGGRVFMNAKTFSEILKWRWRRLDPITTAALLKLGFMGTYYRGDARLGLGRQVWTTRSVPPHFVFVDSLESMTPFPRIEVPPDHELIPLDENAVMERPAEVQVETRKVETVHKRSRVVSCGNCPFTGSSDGMAVVCKHPTHPFFDPEAPYIIEDIADRRDPPPAGCHLRVENHTWVVELAEGV